MKRMIKVLVVAILMVVILVASVSPAMARRISGGILVPQEQPCKQTEDAPGAAGEHLVLNPEGRADGCWVLLPGAASD
jgi:hypothetical protein